MKVLVTGGAGFVGTNLIKRLLSEGHDVVSWDNYSTGLRDNHIKNGVYVNMDINSALDYHNSYWKRFDLVYHLAAIARIQPSFENPTNYLETNGVATMRIAKICSESNIPLIYAGSSSHHSGKFKNPYTFSKDIGEEVLELFEKNYGLEYSIARFYNVYGPYQLTEGGYTTLIGRWMNNIKNGKDCVIYGDGTKRRDFTHVDDIVDGLIKINECKEWGRTFEFGRGKNYSVNEVADMFGIKPIYEKDKPGEAQNTLNIDLTASVVLGWKPQINLVDYINGLEL